MLNKLRKVFGVYEMTWPRLIIFSVICAVYTTACLVIPGVKDTALTEIGVGYECWFILAIFVVSNCKNWKDAAIKCFVFFLISQPLIYIIESVIYRENYLLKYYGFWFILTLLTLPGGAIAYLIKRKDFLGTLVLAIAGGSVFFFGADFFYRSLNELGISYHFYGLFLMAASVLLGFIFIEKKQLKIAYIGIILALAAAWFTASWAVSGLNLTYQTDLPKEGWHIEGAYAQDMNAEIEDDVLKISYRGKTAHSKLEVINDAGEMKYIVISVVDGEVVVEFEDIEDTEDIEVLE